MILVRVRVRVRVRLLILGSFRILFRILIILGFYQDPG